MVNSLLYLLTMATSSNSSSPTVQDFPDGSGIPPTTRLACKLFICSDAEKQPPVSCTAEEKLCYGEPFHTTVARLLYQALPMLQLETIDTTIKDFSNPIISQPRTAYPVWLHMMTFQTVTSLSLVPIGRSCCSKGCC